MTTEHRITDHSGGTYGSSEAAAGWQRSGVARAQLLAPTETERAAAWAEIEDALRQYDNVDELVIPQTYLIGVGTK